MIGSVKSFALLTGVMVVGVIGLAALGFSIGIYDIEERDIYGYQSATNGTDISVYNHDGDVNVYTWDDPQNQTVQVKAHLWCINGKEALDTVSIRFTAGTGLKVESYVEDRNKYAVDSISIDLIVYVPINTNIIKIDTDNGHIKMERCHGNAELDSSDGYVSVREHIGALDIKTDNAGIDIKRQTGNVKAVTSNGEIEMTLVAGNVTAETDNDHITLTSINGSVSAITESANIDMNDVAVLRKAVTDNGEINVHFRNISDTGAKIETSNDNVNVYIPLDLKIRIDMQTANGHASIHNIAVLYEKDEGDYKIGNVNGGGPRLEIDTDNGNIDVYGGVA